MLNLVIFGPPGSGKGTQSMRVACRYNLVQISTGDILRQEVQKGTPLGIKLFTYMCKGLLVPDDIVVRKVFDTMNKFPNAWGFVFDGFPRTIYQARVLDRLLLPLKTSVNIVICLIVDQNELFLRMMARSVDSGRCDDNETTIRKRLEVYNSITKPLKRYYEQQHKVANVSGMAPVKTVSERIARIVEHYRERQIVMPEVGF